MSPSQRPSLILAPSVSTTKVVTTTTTTTTYAPIPLPSLPPPSSPKDPKLYPLLNASLPPSLRRFPITFPGGARATFRDGDDGDDDMHDEDEVMSGRGWRLVRQDDNDEEDKVFGLHEAVERFGKKRTHSNDIVMQGVEEQTNSPPPRKKPRGTHPGTLHINASTAAAPPSPLPSPTGSPPPQSIWPSAPPSGASSPQPQAPIQPDIALTTLMTLPNLLSHFTALPPALQSHVLLTFLRHSPLPVLRTLQSVLTPTLARDFLTLLPRELVSHILSFLPFSTLARASRVSKAWRAIIDSDPVLWQDLMRSTKIWFGGESEHLFSKHIISLRRKAGLPAPGALPLPHPYKILFKSRHLTRTSWLNNNNPKRITFPAHGSHVVTCLIFSHGRIISASDDNSIHVYSPTTGQLIRSLEGHQGGVWALAATKDTLVSGSTDRTVRIWDLKTGNCTHVFGGHTSTVRCLSIVKPEMVEWTDDDGITHHGRWPKRPLIVTGSRDHSLRVWDLPRPGEKEYRCYGADDTEGDPSEACPLAAHRYACSNVPFALQEDVEENPYHKVQLEGHSHAVRALAARGRTLVSGSYDCTVRVWDIITGQSRWVLVGHTQKVYSVVLDPIRDQACSGSMDGTVRVWNLTTGQCIHTLVGHTSLVGLLGLSPSYLVSAAADSSLRVWDANTGELRHCLQAHTGAITCFQHDEFKVLSGSDGTLKMWDIRDGSFVRDLLTGINGVWQVVFEGRWCVAASNRTDATVLDVWDFGRDDDDDDWIGEPGGGLYDDSSDDEDDDEDHEQADADAMDQDLEVLPSEPEMGDDELDGGENEQNLSHEPTWDYETPINRRKAGQASSGRPMWADNLGEGSSMTSIPEAMDADSSQDTSVKIPSRILPASDETPTRPRIRNVRKR
ncbi:WD40 repeat-like protein [Fomitiporia mediterranea MF3/22]|uniref:WD40 repeat-like protein n=1 Tax=Fomitiporia mediterranea (strain MF3/22) TaxID=694068 RepID=UPI0004407D3D|nr:WD40 repeat-like protein [Fomitiporia mediterranea MF3/22]EJD02172.1 WD40 repeat-like protein [Fomitiporia mediterranea MF3/22]